MSLTVAFKEYTGQKKDSNNEAKHFFEFFIRYASVWKNLNTLINQEKAWPIRIRYHGR